MVIDEFWENVFSNLGFEKIVLAGRIAFKIPIYEAIYMCQILGTSEWRVKRNSRGEAHIFLEDGGILMFPNPCPSVRIGDVTTEIKYQESIEHQINPLLSPSLSFVRNNHPSFFNTNFKYLLFGLGSGAAKDIAEEENLRTTDIISLNLPTNKEYMNEAIAQYIISSFLRKKGFIVDPFNEALGTGGFPDLFAFKLSQIQNKLVELGIAEGGFYLNELELLDEEKNGTKIDEDKTVLLEIESPGKNRFYSGIRQTEKYLKGGYYDEGYAVVPFEEFRMNEWAKQGGLDIGFITINENGNVLMKECSKRYSSEKNTKELKKIVERIVKLTLLKNLSLRRVFDLLTEAQSFYDLYFAVDRLDINEIVTSLKQ